MILRILRDPVTPLRLVTVPIELSDVLEAALAKDPAHRPASAAAFAEALRSVERSCSWSPTSYVVWGGPPAAAVVSEPAPAPLPAAQPTPVPDVRSAPGIAVPAHVPRNVVSPKPPPVAVPPTPPPQPARSTPVPAWTSVHEIVYERTVTGRVRGAPPPVIKPGPAEPARRGRRLLMAAIAAGIVLVAIIALVLVQ